MRRIILCMAGLCIAVEGLTGLELCPLRASLMELARADANSCHAVWCSCEARLKAKWRKALAPLFKG